MGLLDSMLGQVLGAAQRGGSGGGSNNAALLQAVLGMLGNDAPGGGLNGLIAGFQRSGLGDVMSSWISTSENQPIAPHQLGQVLGPDALSALTRQTGGQSGDVLGQLVQLLPQVIDQLTPHGQVPASGLGNTSDLLGMLGPR
ncbi:MAG: YidB family protein [Burkholderiales bacterium]